jgi:hypothetical protein
VVVAWREIRAVGRVVKQLLIEMLQQCSSANSCMWMCIVMEKHYTGCQHTKSFVLNGPMQFFFSVSQYKTWLSSQAADFIVIGIQKLILRYDKCLSSDSDYAEKKLKYTCICIFCV